MSILEDARFISVLIVIMVSLGVGTVFYVQFEGLSELDAFYFSAMTLSTVGYGDIVPVTDTGKIFTVFYTFFGLSMVLLLFKIVADHAFSFANVQRIIDRMHKKGDITIREGNMRIRRK